MKKTIVIAQILFLSLLSLASKAQPADMLATASPTAINKIETGTQKTTHLIFPAAIKSVDRGSADILVQQAGGAENVLKVKGAKRNFEETNLTVITGDGSLYSFTVSYKAKPACLVINIDSGAIKTDDSIDKKGPGNTQLMSVAGSDIKTVAWKVLTAKSNLHGVHSKSYKVSASLAGIYIQDNLFYYRIAIRNKSNVSYDIESIRFYIRDRKRFKRTITQELPLEPAALLLDTWQVKAGNENVIVAALPKQMIGRDKELVIEITEKNSGRNLSLKLRNNKLLKAEALN